MKKIVLTNGVEFLVNSVISHKYMNIEKYEIIFDSSVDILDIINLYDSKKLTYDKKIIDTFDLYETDQDGTVTFLGSHYCFTILISVCYKDGCVTLTVEQESELKAQLNETCNDVVYLGNQVCDLELSILEMIQPKIYAYNVSKFNKWKTRYEKHFANEIHLYRAVCVNELTEQEFVDITGLPYIQAE